MEMVLKSVIHASPFVGFGKYFDICLWVPDANKPPIIGMEGEKRVENEKPFQNGSEIKKNLEKTNWYNVRGAHTLGRVVLDFFLEFLSRGRSNSYLYNN